jgi:hypothetical protein
MIISIAGEGASPSTIRLSHWLSLAAAPAFAAMALLTGFVESGSPELLCSGLRAASPLAGMTAMYLLMSLFHSAPWLKLISREEWGPAREPITEVERNHHGKP